MMLSFTLQALAITACVIISILTVDKLGAVSLPQPIPPYPRVPKPVKLVPVPRSTGGSSALSMRTAAPRPFVVPTRIPSDVRMIVDSPEEMLAAAPSLRGSSIGIGGPGVGHPLGSDNGIPAAVAPPPPKPVAAPEQKPVRVGGNVMEARLVKRVMPVYPPLARQARISGTVRLEGVIARDGHIVNLQVHSGHPLLIATAVDAVRQWVYKPTLLNNEPVEVIAPIEVHFMLGQ